MSNHLIIILIQFTIMIQLSKGGNLAKEANGVTDMGKAKRKMRPQPPWWWTLDNDNCWFCKNRNNCGSCKLLKEQSAIERKKRGE